MNDLNKLRVVEDKAFSNVIGRTSELMSGEKYCFTLFLSNCASLHTIQEGAFDGTSLCMVIKASLFVILPKLQFCIEKQRKNI